MPNLDSQIRYFHEEHKRKKTSIREPLPPFEFPSQNELQQYSLTAQNALHHAGNELMNNAIGRSYKTPVSPPYNYLHTESKILEEVRKVYPDHFIADKDENRFFEWQIVGLSGLENYGYTATRRNRNFGVAAGLWIQGQLTVGALYVPLYGSIQSAIQGYEFYSKVLTGNGEERIDQVHVSDTEKHVHYLNYAVIFSHALTHLDQDFRKEARLPEEIAAIIEKIEDIHMTSSSLVDYASILTHQSDMAIYPTKHSVEQQIGELLIRQAGGRVMEYKNITLAGNNSAVSIIDWNLSHPQHQLYI